MEIGLRFVILFDDLGLMYPPPYGNWSQPYYNYWDWEMDEETKIVVALAQSSGSFMLNQTQIQDPNMPDQTIDFMESALQIGGFQNAVEKVLQPMILRGDFEFLFDHTYPNFQQWLNTPLNSDPLAYHFEDDMNFCSPDATPPFTMFLSTTNIGMPVYDEQTNPTGELLNVVIPGKWDFLGGSVISMTTDTQNPALVWKFMAKLVDSNNPYITRMNIKVSSLPPYMSAWTDPVWSNPTFDAHKLALQHAVAPQYPMTGFPQWGTVEATHMFRFFILELKYKNVSVADAVQRLSQRINSLFTISGN
ncbi:hypothetical protein HDU84_006909 [Entophlyctis sp. JEL0112]|nr:hypothetical protein HDU84_006909 [Entophlyctis sp. JEL0112]